MADDPNIYFTASFGGIDLLIATIDTEGGRDVAVQSPSRGSKHVLQDRGRRFGRTTCEIWFIDQPNKDPYLKRYDQFRALVNAGEAQIFSHPIDGSFRARASELDTHANKEELCVVCRCVFLPEDEPQTIFPVGAGASPAAGLEAVTTAATAADTELAAVGLSSDVPSDCLASVIAWSDAADDLDSQQVYVEIAARTAQLSAAMDALDLATDLNRWPSYKAMINLQFQFVRAGEAFTADDGQLFEITVARSMPLLAIAAETYGADFAPDMAPKIAKINRVRTPGRVPPGTVLKMPPRPS
jgi:hypothetical protein